MERVGIERPDNTAIDNGTTVVNNKNDNNTDMIVENRDNDDKNEDNTDVSTFKEENKKRASKLTSLLSLFQDFEKQADTEKMRRMSSPAVLTTKTRFRSFG